METIIDFTFWAGIWALFSPLLVSLFKNIGGSWPTLAKQGLALIMALLGSVFAYSVSAGWGDVALNDFEGFWQPLVIGVVGIFGTQYASYMGIWANTKVLAAAENVGS